MKRSGGETEPSLETLIESIALNRDKHAFKTLFEHCSGKLKGYAIKCGASSDEADELVQETLLTVWQKAQFFNPLKATAYTWLYTIIRNKRIDLHRKKNDAAVQSIDLWQDFIADEANATHESDLNADYVRKLIEVLPEKQREVVFKVYIEGKSHNEIASDLNIPLGTVKSRLRLAIKKLETLAKGYLLWLIIILPMTF